MNFVLFFLVPRPKYWLVDERDCLLVFMPPLASSLLRTALGVNLFTCQGNAYCQELLHILPLTLPLSHTRTHARTHSSFVMAYPAPWPLWLWLGSYAALAAVGAAGAPQRVFS